MPCWAVSCPAQSNTIVASTIAHQADSILFVIVEQAPSVPFVCHNQSLDVNDKMHIIYIPAANREQEPVRCHLELGYQSIVFQQTQERVFICFGMKAPHLSA